MRHLYPVLQRVHERTGIPMSKLTKVYTVYFRTVRDVFRDGTSPGVVLTGLMSFQYKASSIKVKCNNLTQIIVDENYDALKRRFRIETLEDARKLLTNLIRIYKMKKAFDNQNILAKRRKYNGWIKE